MLGCDYGGDCTSDLVMTACSVLAIYDACGMNRSLSTMHD